MNVQFCKIIFFIVSINLPSSIYSQFVKDVIKTDSSIIETIKNSKYHIYEETYLYRDSIYYEVRFADDSTQIASMGWMNKKRKRVGIWPEYKLDGIWLNTKNYGDNTWKYNVNEYKYQYIRDTAKKIADNYLKSIVGDRIFNQNIVFDFNGSLSIDSLYVKPDGTTSYMQKQYLGMWDEPVEKMPNGVLMNYGISLGEFEIYYNRIDIKVINNELIFEHGNNRHCQLQDFKIDTTKAMSINRAIAIDKVKRSDLYDSLNRYPLESSLSYDKLESSDSCTYYYYVTQMYKEEFTGECPKDCDFVRYYNVWKLDVWSNNIIFEKKQLRRGYFRNGHGASGNLSDVKE